MDVLWEFLSLTWMYFSMLWRSYTTTVVSGTAMGIFLAQATSFLVVGCLAWLGVKWFFMLKRRKLRQYIRAMKGKRMSVKEREEYEKFLIGEFLTEGLEELWLQGYITKEKRDWWYKQFAQKFDMQEIVSYQNASVKEQIKRRIRKSVNSMPVPLPGDAPTNVVKLPNLRKRKIA